MLISRGILSLKYHFQIVPEKEEFNRYPNLQNILIDDMYPYLKQRGGELMIKMTEGMTHSG